MKQEVGYGNSFAPHFSTRIQCIRKRLSHIIFLLPSCGVTFIQQEFRCYWYRSSVTWSFMRASIHCFGTDSLKVLNLELCFLKGSVGITSQLLSNRIYCLEMLHGFVPSTKRLVFVNALSATNCISSPDNILFPVWVTLHR
jgi:hypothetical protein